MNEHARLVRAQRVIERHAYAPTVTACGTCGNMAPCRARRVAMAELESVGRLPRRVPILVPRVLNRGGCPMSWPERAETPNDTRASVPPARCACLGG